MLITLFISYSIGILPVDNIVGNNFPAKNSSLLTNKFRQLKMTKRHPELVMSIQGGAFSLSFFKKKILVLLEGATILLIYHRDQLGMRQFVLAVPLTSRDRLQIQG